MGGENPYQCNDNASNCVDCYIPALCCVTLPDLPALSFPHSYDPCSFISRSLTPSLIISATVFQPLLLLFCFGFFHTWPLNPQAQVKPIPAFTTASWRQNKQPSNELSQMWSRVQRPFNGSMGKDSLFHKLCWGNWLFMCKRKKLVPYLTKYSKINSKWIQNLHWGT